MTQGYTKLAGGQGAVLFNPPLIFNHQHQRGNMRDAQSCSGKILGGPVYLNKGRRTFYMQCRFHAYMESWAAAVNNPYYA